jgi:hypothetical protein
MVVVLGGHWECIAREWAGAGVLREYKREI